MNRIKTVIRKIWKSIKPKSLFYDEGGYRFMRLGQREQNGFQYHAIWGCNWERHVAYGKIKVSILFDAMIWWNHWEPILKAFLDDDGFDTLVIINDRFQKDGHNIMEMIQSVKALGGEYIEYSHYSASRDNPDIVLINDPVDDATDLLSLKQHSKQVIFISSYLMHYRKTTKEFAQLLKNNIGILDPDYYCFDSYLYNQIKELKDSSFDNKLVELGNSKYDGIYWACKNKITKWDKLKGRKVVLWTTTHGAYGNAINVRVTFDLFARYIFDYFRGHKEFGLIFRPHPLLIMELIKNYQWKQSEIDEIIREMDASDNMVFDQSETYNFAYASSDAIVGDLDSGIMISAFPMMKPILGLHRPETNANQVADFAQDVYRASRIEDIQSFFDMIMSGEDYMLEQRKKRIRKYVKNYEGNNGVLIKEFIKEQFRKRVIK